MKSRRTIGIGYWLATSFILFPITAQAGGFTMTLMGSRRTGMQANIASVDDVSALFHNPAGLGKLKGRRLHLSNTTIFLRTRFKMQGLDPQRYPEVNPQGCGEADTAPCPWPLDAEGYYDEIKPEKYFGVIPFFGGSTDLGFINPKAKDIVVAAAIYAPDFYGGFFPEQAPTAYYLIEGIFMVVAGTVGVSWRINEHISIGANLAYHNMRMSFAQKYSMIDVLTPRGESPGTTAQLAQALFGDLRLDFKGLDHGLGWSFGIMLDPVEWLSIGLVYNGATAAEFEGDVHLAPGNEEISPEDFEEVAGALGFKLPKRLMVEMIIPHSLMGGINIHPTYWFEAGLDFRIWFYNFYHQQRIVPYYDDSAEGTEPLTEESLTREKEYFPSWSISLGLMFKPIKSRPDFNLMMGVGFDYSPIPDETFSLDNPSLHQLLSSVGARFTIREFLTLSASYMVIRHMGRDVTNSTTNPPTNARGAGWGHLPALMLEGKW